jgi:hypothetical protein
MKRKLVLVTAFMILTLSVSHAQSYLTMKSDAASKISEDSGKNDKQFIFKAYSFDYELNDVPADMVGKHQFGDLIARKIYLLDKRYVSEVNITPGNPATKTVIRKPVLYESVRKVEKDLKKSVRKGDISASIAADTFNKILDVAINIFSDDTRDFEDILSKSSDTNSIIELFTKRVILNY